MIRKPFPIEQRDRAVHDLLLPRGAAYGLPGKHPGL